MAASSRVAMLVTMAALLALLLSPGAMSYRFDSEKCPNLDSLVYQKVHAAIAEDAGVVPGLLRLTFHDCFPQGCDASILLTGEGSEQALPQNAGLRQNAIDLIESIRETAHEDCGGPYVSCADITNLATKQALMQSGVPGYVVTMGRDDSLAPASKEEVGILPGPDDSIYKIAQTFHFHGGFDLSQVVALSGAHTIGRASCGSFKNRRDDNAEFVEGLRKNCSIFPEPPLQDLDVTTPHTFDNKYYVNLLAKKGVLNSDMALTDNDYTNTIVHSFVDNEWVFLNTFSTSMQQLANMTGGPVAMGQIRNNCFRVNKKEATAQAQGFAASA